MDELIGLVALAAGGWFFRHRIAAYARVLQGPEARRRDEAAALAERRRTAHLERLEHENLPGPYTHSPTCGECIMDRRRRKRR